MERWQTLNMNVALLLAVHSMPATHKVTGGDYSIMECPFTVTLDFVCGINIGWFCQHLFDKKFPCRLLTRGFYIPLILSADENALPWEGVMYLIGYIAMFDQKF